MFTQNRITGVGASGVRTAQALPTKVSGKRKGYEMLADLSSGGSHSTSTNVMQQSQFNYTMTGILPADPRNPDTSSLALFYRDCYLLDATAGSAVDIQSVFPFSDWELRGLEEKQLEPFNATLERLNLRQMMPEISTAYLVDGFFCGSLIYDTKTRAFMDTLIHDALQCSVVPSPFYNVDPAVTVNVAASVQQFMASHSKYAQKYMKTMPADFMRTLREGSFTLDPVTTLFIARRGLTDRAYTSYLHRVLPMYLIEKTMFRGTLVEATKRQRATTHLQAGDDTWTPTSEELTALVQMFQASEADPLGGWVATRNAVQVSDIRTAGDFWKWTDMGDILLAYKMRALGISEALLSGDASYASAESAMSTFLETCNAYRSHLTSQIFYRRIFPLIAVTNGFFKDKSKAKRTENPLDFLFNANNSGNLQMPQVVWHKGLESKQEDTMFDMLDKASEKGVPIPMKMWMAAANIDKDTLLRDLSTDKQLTDALNKLKGDTEHQRPGGDGEDEQAFDNEVEAHLNRITSASLGSGYRASTPLSERQFHSHDLFTIGKTGQKQHVYNQEAKKKDLNAKIVKIAIKAQRDPNYRAALRQRNIETKGTAVLQA